MKCQQSAITHFVYFETVFSKFFFFFFQIQLSSLLNISYFHLKGRNTILWVCLDLVKTDGFHEEGKKGSKCP